MAATILNEKLVHFDTVKKCYEDLNIPAYYPSSVLPLKVEESQLNCASGENIPDSNDHVG